MMSKCKLIILCPYIYSVGSLRGQSYPQLTEGLGKIQTISPTEQVVNGSSNSEVKLAREGGER